MRNWKLYYAFASPRFPQNFFFVGGHHHASRDPPTPLLILEMSQVRKPQKTGLGIRRVSPSPSKNLLKRGARPAKENSRNIMIFFLNSNNGIDFISFFLNPCFVSCRCHHSKRLREGVRNSFHFSGRRIGSWRNKSPLTRLLPFSRVFSRI